MPLYKFSYNLLSEQVQSANSIGTGDQYCSPVPVHFTVSQESVWLRHEYSSATQSTGRVRSWKPLPEGWRRDCRSRRDGACCSELENVRIGDSDIVNHIVGFEVFRAVTMKKDTFLDVAPCGFIINIRFGGTCRH
jgi:hypothetical protein